MVPERVRTITTATYEAVDTDQEFTISELKDVLHRLKDTVLGDDTVCYSMIKNTPLIIVSSNFPLPLFCTFVSYIIEPKKVIQCAGMCQERTL